MTKIRLTRAERQKDDKTDRQKDKKTKDNEQDSEDIQKNYHDQKKGVGWEREGSIIKIF